MSHFLEGPFLPLFFLGISSAYNVVEGCLQFSVDDLILGHHVHSFQVEKLLPNTKVCELDLNNLLVFFFNLFVSV